MKRVILLLSVVGILGASCAPDLIHAGKRLSHYACADDSCTHDSERYLCTTDETCAALFPPPDTARKL